MYISRQTAERIGRELVEQGKAKAFTVIFARERCPDTRELLVGFKLITR